MDLECKKLAIRRLIEESAAPRPASASCVKHITVIGDNNIIADRVIVQASRYPASMPQEG